MKDNKIDLQVFADIIKELQYGSYESDLRNNINEYEHHGKMFGYELVYPNPLDYLHGFLQDILYHKSFIDFELPKHLKPKRIPNTPKVFTYDIHKEYVKNKYGFEYVYTSLVKDKYLEANETNIGVECYVIFKLIGKLYRIDCIYNYYFGYHNINLKETKLKQKTITVTLYNYT